MPMMAGWPLVEAMALDRDVAALVSQRAILAGFSSPTLAEAGRAVVAAWEREASSASAIDHLPASVAERVTAGLLGEGAIAQGDRLRVARDCIERVEQRKRRLEAREIRANLRQAEAAGDDVRLREQLRQNNDLLRRKEFGRE